MSLTACPHRCSDDATQPVPIRPLRVCFIIDDLSVAGIEGQLLLLLKHLDRSKVEPYLCLLNGDERLTYLEPDHCPIIRLKTKKLLRPSSCVQAIRFGRYLRRERIDVLHPLFPDSLYFGAVVARLARVPCVVRFRVDLGYWMTATDRWLGRVLSRLVNATMVNCEACRQVAITQEGAKPESVAVIPNGVDLARFDGPPENGDRPHLCAAPSGPLGQMGTVPVFDRVRRVGVVANLRPVKNLGLFVRAAADLKSSHPDVRFQIAGEGECRTELESLIRELGMQDRFDLLGTVADIPAFLRRLDVAVLCSHSEGSPNAIMEYMAAGLPSIVTDVGGNGELVEHERFGLVVPPNDIAGLSAAIARLLDDRPLALRMGQAARQRAFAEFGVETQARRYEEFYRELLSKKRHRP